MTKRQLGSFNTLRAICQLLFCTASFQKKSPLFVEMRHTSDLRCVVSSSSTYILDKEKSETSNHSVSRDKRRAFNTENKT